jgi:uncharacterized protein (DUF427 family)
MTAYRTESKSLQLSPFSASALSTFGWPTHICPHGDRFNANRGAAMVKAIWNGKVIAEADRTEIVEGNHYFPSESLREEFFQPSDTHTICPWKGKAHYYTLLVDGKENADAAWYYPDPKPAARKIAGNVAFWKGVRIET